MKRTLEKLPPDGNIRILRRNGSESCDEESYGRGKGERVAPMFTVERPAESASALRGILRNARIDLRTAHLSHS